MTKISYQDYINLALNPKIDEEVYLSFSVIKQGEGGFDFIVVPDPDKVELSDEELGLENAMAIGNDAARIRRKIKFVQDRIFHPNRPVLVSEGDSWFQFPLLIHEIVDQLNSDYAIWSVGAAGDTAKNMVNSGQQNKKTEYMIALKAQKKKVQAFLFSAAGNDIIGEDPVSKESALLSILNPFNGNTSDILGHINKDVLNEKLAFLKDAYQKVFNDIRDESGFSDLPIIIHGYDYAFPHPWGMDDPRHPKHAKKNQWLGRALDERNFPFATKDDLALRRGIIIHLIDKLYNMLESISGKPENTGIWIVNCRGAMPDVTDWIDEIHGTSSGFSKVAVRFNTVLNKALKANT